MQYIYLLDWPQSISEDAPRLEVTQYHLMENWRKVGYFAGPIQDRNSFLRQHSRFIVVDIPPLVPTKEPPIIGNPFYKSFCADPAYQVLPYGTKNKDGVQDTWLVCRGSCGQP